MATAFDTSLGAPPLSEAIDRQPLVVTPDTCLGDVVILMHETAHRPSTDSLDSALQGARSSCVLVMEAENLLGIFTERDLVQLTALGASLQAKNLSIMAMREVMHYPVLTIGESMLHDVFAALFLFRRHRVRHLVIVKQPSQQLVGVISLDSIRHILRPTNLLKIRRVAEVMTHEVITALPSMPVLTLTALMAAHRISCIVIVQPAESENEAQHPVGIVTERDIVRFQALGLDLQHTLAEQVMSTPIFVLSPEDSLWTAHQEMEQRQVRRLVVSWNWGRNLAIVTQTCILRVFDPVEMHGVIETLQRTVQQLGLDLDQVLASAINHDLHLSVSTCTLPDAEQPNLKVFMGQLQTQLADLIDHPHMPPEERQAALQSMLSQLEHVQKMFYLANVF
jgi:CBS domain-containing protein